MNKGRYFKIILTVCAVMISAPMAMAQKFFNDNELLLEFRGGHSAAFGHFAAASLQTLQKFDDSIVMEAGIQYNSIGRTVLEARPAYLWDYEWGMLLAEMLLSYTNMASINSFAAGAGLKASGTWVGGRLGYYYRLFGGNGDRIDEPFNIYYELNINLLPMFKYWDLRFSITNNEIFELERHYSPSFIIECRHYPISALGINLGFGCKPSGMFHLSAGYYQTFINLGVCYRW